MPTIAIMQEPASARRFVGWQVAWYGLLAGRGGEVIISGGVQKRKSRSGGERDLVGPRGGALTYAGMPGGFKMVARVRKDF